MKRYIGLATLLLLGCVSNAQEEVPHRTREQCQTALMLAEDERGLR
jgi:hypothetical protein